MKVLVLSDDDQREELLACTVQPGIELLWAVSLEDADKWLPIDACIDLLFEYNTDKIARLRNLNCLVVVNSVEKTLGGIGDDFIRINGWTSFINRPLVEASVKDESLKVQAIQLFHLLGRRIEWLPDVAGFVSARVVAAIINEAFLALEEGVSDENEIDTAMRLGTNYPYGPFEWGKKIGLGRVYSLLATLQQEQTRYKPSQLLMDKILV